MAEIYDQKYNELEYARFFIGLFPSGNAWPRIESGNKLFDLSRGHALELERLDVAVSALVQNGYPTRADDFLSDWERLLGLPDDADGIAATTVLRQATITKRLITIGQLLIDYGLNDEFFIQLGLLYGFTVTSIDAAGTATQCGVAQCGLDECGGIEDIFTWTVHSVLAPVAEVQAIFNRFKPKHTILIFEQP